MAEFDLDSVLDRLIQLPTDKQRVLFEKSQQFAAQQGMARWQPNPGSQSDAYFSEADETGYGGEAGPGKTSLIIGLSITAHQRSLVLRRTSVEARGLVDEYEKVLGGRPTLDRNETFRVDGRRIQIGGCDHEERKQKYKGLPRDLIAFDELPDFTESQYTFIIQWARSTDPKQRCRVVATFNPPTRATGLWVINRFGPWLDPHHPNPADSGEIRWFTTVDGRDTEVDGPGPHDVGEPEPVKALSRTFIRGYLSENTALAATGYDATRAAAPKIYRDAYRSGDFEAALADVPNQVCPTAWVRAAVQRWSPRPPDGIPMCSIGVDACGGGEDPMVLAIRHDGWYAPMIEIPGKNIPEDRPGHYAAGVVMGYRRDDALIVVDMGGGYGGPLYEKLHDNHVAAEAFKGSEKSTRRTREGKKGFANRRSEIYWKFREALDPEQPGGSPIFLPDDRLLIADLTAPVFLEDSHVIELEPKERVRERLGRSPDRGDATVMAWAAGMRYVQGGMALERAQKFNYAGGRRPQVLMGRGKYNAPRR